MPRLNSEHSWDAIINSVAASLTDEDDPRFWETAVTVLFSDAEYLCIHSRCKSAIVAEIGACSHWLRPHQSRWTKDGGFAAPIGYSGAAFNFNAWPEFDWSQRFRWDLTSARWIPTEKVRDKRTLTFRATLPTRTNRHDQAAVHTVWTPGSPTTPKEEVLGIYGFRKNGEQWECTATDVNETPFDIAASEE